MSARHDFIGDLVAHTAKRMDRIIHDTVQLIDDRATHNFFVTALMLRILTDLAEELCPPDTKLSQAQRLICAANVLAFTCEGRHVERDEQAAANAYAKKIYRTLISSIGEAEIDEHRKAKP